ncbi:MAG: mechanosensitive ion channel family protein [Candidatus Riflebacteria bacterium]|nr:mechanosensitive ion channel family protein [Candidatus Riflebacteria bacterium]
MPSLSAFSLIQVDDLFVAVLACLAVITIGEFLLKTLNKTLKKFSPGNRGVLAIANNSIYFPVSLIILALGVKTGFRFLPANVTNPAWLSNIDFFLSFLMVLTLGEFFFGLIVDFYLREKRGTDIPKIFSQLFKTIIYVIIGLSFASTIYRIDITPLLTTSAVFTMVIGLALQDVLGNLFAGLSVHISPPFKIGDWIKTQNWFGKVIESNWRATTLISPLNEIIVLPNNDIAKKEIVNLSFIPGKLLMDFSIGLSYDTSPERARKALLEACRQVKEILSDPTPLILVMTFGESAIVYQIRFWIKDTESQQLVKNQLASRVWYRLKRDSLSIPYPIQEVYLHQKKDHNAEILTERIRIVSSIDFLAKLPREGKVVLSNNLRELWFESGETIFQKNSSGKDFYIIDRGKVSVFIDDQCKEKVATLTDCDFFGEMSFLTGEPRSATIIAETETCVLVLKSQILGDLLKNNPDIANILSEALANRKEANIQRMERGKSGYGPSEASENLSSNIDKKSTIILEKIRSFFRL